MCNDKNPKCNHLFLGNGAVNTIVRLPNSVCFLLLFLHRSSSRTDYLDSQCGPNPFARVAQHRIIQSNLVARGNGSEASIHELTLDTDFAAAGPSQWVLSYLRSS